MNESPFPSGHITALPNPLPPGTSPTVIQWETTPAAPAELVVSDNDGPEQLVGRGPEGHSEISWVQDGRHYDFHLYQAGEPRRKLASLRVHRSTFPIGPLLSEVSSRLRSGELEPGDFGNFVASLIKPQLDQPEFEHLFRVWEESGFHVTAVGDDGPLPETRALADKPWEESQELPGFDLNPTSQRKYVCEIFPDYRRELEQLPMTHSNASNGSHGGLDAAITYCMVRHSSPNRVMEIGGNQSTLVLREALRTNRRGTLLFVEPRPEKVILDPTTKPEELLREEMKSLELAKFAELDPGDILSVKTSHVIKLGSDVNSLFFEILPRLKTGVIVQLCDIFLPFDYPKEWVIEGRRFWTAQYLLQAFLSGNADFEVLVSSGYLLAAHSPELQAAFPRCERLEGSAFWMRRRRATGAKRVTLKPLTDSR
ncbi:MAG: hypothetical protein ABI233_04445 [Chthoniobacterales bacterium]